MNDKEKISAVKCKCCGKVLSIEIKAFQTCKCGKVMFDTAGMGWSRILGNKEDYEIIEG